MKTYFYSDGANSYGPFTFEQLLEKQITPNTKVWCAGMTDWQDANKVAELEPLFGATPPPINMDKDNGQKPKMPASYLVLSILSTIFCCMPFGIVGIVYAAKVESRYLAGDFVGAKRASNSAKTWTWLSIGLGLFGGLIWILLMIFGALASTAPFWAMRFGA